MKRLIGFTVVLSLLAACTPSSLLPEAPVTDDPGDIPLNTPSGAAPENPYAPQPADDQLVRGSAFMNSADLLLMESLPIQVAMILRGNLPTPCHSLRVVINAPDGNNNIDVAAYSVTNPDRMCAQVLQSFEASIPLGSFPPGHYTVSVNGERVGEFDA